jgi:ferredoxin
MKPPFWITTRYGGKCSSCHLGIKKGEDALYYPGTKKLLCSGQECGRKVVQEAKANKVDEFLYGAWR